MPDEPVATATDLPSCPTHAVCPPCREGWGHYTAGRGYSPTVESERVRHAYAFSEWLSGFPSYDLTGIHKDPATGGST